MLGCKNVPDLMAHNAHDFYADKAARENVLREEVAAGAGKTVESALIRLDGRAIWIREDAAAVTQPDGRVVYEGTISEITEQVKAEQRLRQSEARYRALVEQLSDLVDTHLPDTTLTFVNEAYCRYFQKARQELIGSSWIQFLSEKDRERILRFRSSVTPENPSVTYDERTILPSGEERWQQWTDTAIFGKNREIIEFIGVGHDITKRLEYERKLGALHEHASKLSTARSVDEIVEHTLDAMQFNLGFNQAEFRLVEECELRVKGSRGISTTPLNLRLDGPGITVRAAVSKISINVSDTTQESSYVDFVGIGGGSSHDMLSELAVPVVIDSECVAVLNVENAAVGAFSEMDQRLLEILAFHVASEIKRLRDDQQLRANEEKYRFLYESSPALNLILNLDGTVRDINRTGLASLGLRKEEVIGKNVLDFATPRRKSFVAVAVANVLKGMPNSSGMEMEIFAKNGARRTLLFPPGLAMIEENHKRTAVLLTAMDVTDRRSLEEQLERYSKQLEGLVIQRTKSLRESQEKLAAIIQASPESIIVTDLDGRIIDCNEATIGMHGYESRAELIGKDILSLIAQKDHEIASENAKRTLETGVIREIAYSCLKKNGQEFPTEFSISVVRDAKSQPIALVAVMKDLTEHNELGDRLRKAERLAAIGETATMVAHDLRNPLQGITGAAYFLRSKLRSCGQADSEEVVDLIDNCVQYSNKIVDDLLDYAREPRPQLENVTPHSLIELALAHVSIPQPIELINQASEETTLSVDKTKMQRVIINLVRNAIEAMPSGGRITITSFTDSTSAGFSIADTGPGIPDEVKDKLWKPLKTTKARGIGLGLAICKRFVEAHRGRIEVLSETGKGTTFKVTIPIVEDTNPKRKVISPEILGQRE